MRVAGNFGARESIVGKRERAQHVAPLRSTSPPPRVNELTNARRSAAPLVGTARGAREDCYRDPKGLRKPFGSVAKVPRNVLRELFLFSHNLGKISH